jgi:hypothetical protein
MVEYDWLKKFEHFKIVEADDHIIELRYRNVVINRYAQSGVTEETLKNKVEELSDNIGMLERTINNQN